MDRRDLSYAVEWGGRPWRELVSAGLEHVDVLDRDVLEIGGRSGRMAAYLAGLGAHVTTIDIDAVIISSALVEAARLGVIVDARLDPGDLSSVRDGAYDVVFTKSVLVKVPDLGRYLDTLRCKVRSGGRLIAVENAKSSPLLGPLRLIRHGRPSLRQFTFFDEGRWMVVAERFEPTYRRHVMLPPVDLFVGVKRERLVVADRRQHRSDPRADADTLGLGGAAADCDRGGMGRGSDIEEQEVGYLRDRRILRARPAP